MARKPTVPSRTRVKAQLSCARSLERSQFSPVVLLMLSFLFIHLFSSVGWSSTPSGTIITNVATATYTPASAGSPVTVTSPAASVTSMVQRTTAVIEFLEYAPVATGVQQLTVKPTSYSPHGNTAGPFVSSSRRFLPALPRPLTSISRCRLFHRPNITWANRSSFA